MSELESRDLDERVEVRIGIKETKDFNSVMVEVGLTRKLKAGESLKEAYDSVRRGLEKELDRTYDHVTGKSDGN